MGRRGEPDEKEARGGVTEGGQRTAPVGLAAETAGGQSGRLFAPGDEPRASAAGDDFPLEPAEVSVGRIQRRDYFPVSVASARTSPFIVVTSSAFVAPAASGTSAPRAYTEKTYR